MWTYFRLCPGELYKDIKYSPNEPAYILTPCLILMSRILSLTKLLCNVRIWQLVDTEFKFWLCYLSQSQYSLSLVLKLYKKNSLNAFIERERERESERERDFNYTSYPDFFRDPSISEVELSLHIHRKYSRGRGLILQTYLVEDILQGII